MTTTGVASVINASGTEVARQFFVPSDVIQGEGVTLPEELTYHLRTVLRLTEGDEIVLLDGRGNYFRCTIDGLEKQAGRARILEQWQVEEYAIPVQLIQGIPKGDKMEMVLQKGTELGISRFSPVWSERSIPAPAPGREAKKQYRWQRIVSEAARQSRRPILPVCDCSLPLDVALAECRAELKLMLWEDGSQPLREVLPDRPPRDIAIMVGPEGGFSAAEAELARTRNFIPIHLGARILRTETAGFAVSAVLQYLYGDFGVR